MSTVCPCTVLARVIQDQQGTRREVVFTKSFITLNLEDLIKSTLQGGCLVFMDKLCYSDCLYV